MLTPTRRGLNPPQQGERRGSGQEPAGVARAPTPKCYDLAADSGRSGAIGAHIYAVSYTVCRPFMRRLAPGPGLSLAHGLAHGLPNGFHRWGTVPPFPLSVPPKTRRSHHLTLLPLFPHRFTPLGPPYNIQPKC